jgi:hypothetical protein
MYWLARHRTYSPVGTAARRGEDGGLDDEQDGEGKGRAWSYWRWRQTAVQSPRLTQVAVVAAAASPGLGDGEGSPLADGGSVEYGRAQWVPRLKYCTSSCHDSGDTYPTAINIPHPNNGPNGCMWECRHLLLCVVLLLDIVGLVGWAWGSVGLLHINSQSDHDGAASSSRQGGARATEGTETPFWAHCAVVPSSIPSQQLDQCGRFLLDEHSVRNLTHGERETFASLMRSIFD